ncbi:MAG: PQQ-dependent sugar dehydrogenase [Acidimicrobiia bacterium]
MRLPFLILALILSACIPDQAALPPDTTTATTTTSVTSVPPEPSTTIVETTTTTVEPTTTTSLDPLLGIELEEVAAGLDQPVLAVSPPGDDRLFVVERRGVIRIIGADTPFLDIDARVNSEDGIEPGLLGLAFHPDYATNGRFFVYYYQADAERTRLAEYRVSDDPGRADAGSEMEILGFDQPTNRHNGGMLQFGPDAMLWVSLGEGGAASTHAQDPTTLLSAILRLDVDSAGPYAVPADNPFVDGGGAPEVWAYGLRNPWRFSIDPVDGLLYIGDVGHERWEEIDVVPIDSGGGYNFGWLRMEGTACFQSGCDAAAENLTLPVYEYPHEGACSVTGGHVYRGAAIPELHGEYFFGDWCGGWVKSFRYEGSPVTEATDRFEDVGQVNGFGVDAEGELYVVTWEGTVSKLVAIR